MAMPAEFLLPEDSTERCERQFLAQARERIDGAYAAADLTQTECIVYTLREGYLSSWRDIAGALGTTRGLRMVETVAARRRHKLARGKLIAWVLEQGLTQSPLHPCNWHVKPRWERLTAKVCPPS